MKMKCNVAQKRKLNKQLNKEFGEAITFLILGFDEYKIDSLGNYVKIQSN